MNIKNKNILISVGIVIFKEDKIIFGLSEDKDGNEKYILPVGHLKYMESFEACAKREVSEECGIKIKDIEFQFVSNTDNYSPKHYIHIGLKAKWLSAEPKVLEKGAIMKWEWIAYENIPKNLSKGAQVTIEALAKNIQMYDISK